LQVALQRHAGRSGPIAAALKLTRHGLLKKLKKYNLTRQQPKRSAGNDNGNNSFHFRNGCFQERKTLL
jgi:hypothetical protein